MFLVGYANVADLDAFQDDHGIDSGVDLARPTGVLIATLDDIEKVKKLALDDYLEIFGGDLDEDEDSKAIAEIKSGEWVDGGTGGTMEDETYYHYMVNGSPEISLVARPIEVLQ